MTFDFAAYAARKREAARRQAARARIEDPEGARLYAAVWREQNREYYNARQRAWRQKHKNKHP